MDSIGTPAFATTNSGRRAALLRPIWGVLLLVGVLAVALGGSYRYFMHDAASGALARIQLDLTSQAIARQSFLEEELDQLRHEVLMFASHPPVFGIARALQNEGVDAWDNTPLKLWQERLQQIFHAAVDQQRNYLRLRLVGLADRGRELVSLKRDLATGQIVAAASNELESLEREEWFEPACQLPAGQVYFSEFDFSWQAGKILIPQTLTVCVITPVYDDQGACFGLMVLDLQAGMLLQKLSSVQEGSSQLFLMNAAGRFLLHPDPTRGMAAAESTTGSSLAADYLDMTDRFSLRGAVCPPGMKVYRPVAVSAGEPLLVIAREITLDGAGASRKLFLWSAMPQSFADALTWELALPRLYRIWGLVAGLGGLLGLVLWQQHVSRIRFDLRARMDSWERLHGAFAQAAIGCAIADADSGEIVFVNARLCEMLGYTEAELVGAKFMKLLHPDDAPAQAAQIERLRSGEIPSFIIENRYARKDGVQIWARKSVAIIHDTSGALRWISALAEDISSRKQAEAALRQFKNTLDAIHDSVFMFHPETLQYFYVNQGACQQVGYSEAELLEMHPYDIKPEYPEPKFRERIAPLLSGRQPSLRFETVQRHKNGHDVPVEAFLHYIDRAGESPRFAVIVTDITARKAAEAALVHARDTLARAQKVAKVGSFEFRAETQTFEWSAETKRLHGMAPDGPSPTFEQIVARVHPDDREAVVEFWEKFLRGVAPGEWEYRVVLPSGSVIWLNIRAELDHDERGELCAVGTTLDITERKRLEHALVDERNQLDQTVCLRTQELEHAKEAAESATRAKSGFLANMSHEVRSPMSVIVGYADVLLDPATSPADRETAVSAIRRNGRHLLQVINDVLDLARIEAGKMPLELGDVAPWELLQAVIETYQPTATEKQIELTLAAEEYIPVSIRSDSTRLRQILMNFLSNALKFTESGKQVAVKMSVQQAPRALCISVTDQGIGMTPEEVSRLFKPFEQADSTTTRKYGGTGLGLSISKQLAEAMGGSIEVESSPGAGTTFRLLLPMEKLTPLRPPPAPSSDPFIAQTLLSTKVAVLKPTSASEAESVPMPVNQGRILLVEDSLDLQTLMAYRLRTAGYDVTTAANGRIGRDLALQRPFDVILMDIQMPEMDGATATRELRQQGYRGPIIGLSAHAMRGEREKNLAQGMNEYLTKPVETNALVATLQRFIHKGESSNNAAAVSSQFTALLRGFLQRVPDRLVLMRRALESGDWESLARQAHQLKGTAASYEVSSLSETATLLEAACQEGQSPVLLLELVQELSQEADRLTGEGAGNMRREG